MPRHVAVRVLDGWHDPERVFIALATEATTAVWLDGGIDATSGRSVIAIAHDTSRIVVAGSDDDPDAVLGELRDALRRETATSRMSDASHDTPSEQAGDRRVARDVRHFGDGVRGESGEAAHTTMLGWLGWFGYEFGARRLGVPVATDGTPEAAWLFADRGIVFDHARRTVRLEWLGSQDGDAWAVQTAAAIEALDEASGDPIRGEARAAEASVDEASAVGPTAAEASVAADPPAPRWRHGPDAYASMIAACQAAIARGDAYQLCLTNRVDVGAHPDPLETYLRLRRSSPTHHGGYLRFGDTALLSASPEQFLLVEPDGRVSTRPMKGTRPRGATPADDERLRRELEASEKERAENLMIVDLMRNDVSRIAELGSVHVPDLLVTESYPHVHQLVSTVAARLRAGLTAVDALAAAFPAGSMTGAPKESAMRILHDLERGPRGVYSGVFGSLAVDGSADLAMVIRSIVLTPRGASVGTGGGITALSDIDDEIEETRIKARALLAVLAPPA
ncbi:anthranilate synthase component I family protein [Agromyces aerolatus]|uniref:anthranilate synthase component I family protein n=1 Tax=Agromyces sp. LY-1074 TaxID=3074080 RepID=UPI0028575761|nr:MULTISPECIES: anthranilate synthase component I family protein [unclassified Agromyces]MDR5700741.1 anthranilate synthase component I family protein [Agromyces sp. LY-1074]MDR5707262.1 anthranilate synthase component I family protein [Agromyces sp. LY-1358]